MRSTTRPAAFLLALVLLVGAVVAGGGRSHTGSASPRPTVRRPSPNVVFVLTDDLAWNLVRYMPHVREMQRHGVTFSHYIVTDSLCCPSRASIFSGRLPHDTRVFSNSGPDGGLLAFHARGEEAHTFATALRRAGYRTAMLGKYLNGYTPGLRLGAARPYAAPGWTDWNVAGYGYPEFGYRLDSNGAVRTYGHRPRDYLTDVIRRKGIEFIRRSARTRRPFLLELATFAPHHPYTPAPRDRHDFPGLRAPRTPSFDRPNTNPPSWLAPHPPLRAFQIHRIDRDFRRRAQSVQAVDRTIGAVERALRAAGVQRNTYVVFSSDNGLHMGEHRLTPGKLT